MAQRWNRGLLLSTQFFFLFNVAACDNNSVSLAGSGINIEGCSRVQLDELRLSSELWKRATVSATWTWSLAR